MFDSQDLIESEKPVVGDLYDDLADIYGDLWEGIQALKAGEKTEALSLWVTSYFFHWGHHASAALKALDDFYRVLGPYR